VTLRKIAELGRIPRFCLSLILPATHHFLYTGMEGALANADSAATSEVAAPTLTWLSRDWLSSASAFSQGTPRSR
jgi:hypothetical protein